MCLDIKSLKLCGKPVLLLSSLQYYTVIEHLCVQLDRSKTKHSNLLYNDIVCVRFCVITYYKHLVGIN